MRESSERGLNDRTHHSRGSRCVALGRRNFGKGRPAAFGRGGMMQMERYRRFRPQHVLKCLSRLASVDPKFLWLPQKGRFHVTRRRPAEGGQIGGRWNFGRGVSHFGYGGSRMALRKHHMPRARKAASVSSRDSASGIAKQGGADGLLAAATDVL